MSAEAWAERVRTRAATQAVAAEDAAEGGDPLLHEAHEEAARHEAVAAVRLAGAPTEENRRAWLAAGEAAERAETAWHDSVPRDVHRGRPWAFVRAYGPSKKWSPRVKKRKAEAESGAPG